jgi:hypothetical protein
MEGVPPPPLPPTPPPLPLHQPPNLPYMASLNIHNLMKLTNNPILHNLVWPPMLTNIPLNILNFEGKLSKDPTNHIMTFDLWCSSNSIAYDSIYLRLFQITLTKPFIKWYINEVLGSHANFEKLANAFLMFFQLPIQHDTCPKILTNFHQKTSTPIMGHIHEMHQLHSLCKIEFKNKILLYWILKYLLPLITKDVAITMPQT